MADSINQSALDDLFSKALVEGYVTNPRFVRRDWLAAEVDALLAEPDGRFVLLTAEPGAGKSSFMAQLAAVNPEWPRYFIRRDQRDVMGDVGVHSFLLRIGYQLAALFPELFAHEQVKIAIEQRIGTIGGQGEVIGAEVKRILASPFYTKVLQIQQQVEQNQGSIVGLRVEELVLDPRLIDQKDLQFMALIDPALALLKRDPTRQIVVLVDALDEIRYHGFEGSLLRWLIDCPELPGNVRFVLTSRPPEGEVVTFREKKQLHIKQLTINPEDGRVQGELKIYVENLLSMPEVATILKDTERKVEDFTTEAVKKADGNIGYLDAIARGIDQALSVKEAKEAEGLSLLNELLSLKVLPKDIQELYGFFLHQIKNRPSVRDRSIRVRDESTGKDHFLSAWAEVYKPILGILSVAFEPLSVDQIHVLGGIVGSRDDVIEAMEWLRQFLDEERGHCRFYHATMPEFLTNGETKNHSETMDLFIDARDWHRCIVHAYQGGVQSWEKVDWGRVDDYGLRYLMSHLYVIREEPEYRSRLYKLICKPFMEKKLSRFHSHSSFSKDVELAIQVAAADESTTGLVELVRDCLVFATLISSATNVPAEILGLLAQTGEIDRAFGYAVLIEDKSKQSEAYRRIGEVLQDQGKIEECRKAIEQALDAAEANRVDSGRSYALRDLAPALAQLGDRDLLHRALAATETMEEEQYRSESLSNLAPALSLLGDREILHRALAAVEAYQFRRSAGAIENALRPVALAFAQLEDREGLCRALSATKALKGGIHGACALLAVVPALAQLGDRELLRQALVTAEEIEDVGYRTKALRAVAHGLFSIGDLASAVKAARKALDAAEAIRVNEYKAEALIAVAQVMDDIGERSRAVTVAKKALAVANTIKGERERPKALNAVARGMNCIGERERAVEVANEALSAAQAIQSEWDISSTLSEVAKVMAQTGDKEGLNQAVAVAEAIKDDKSRAFALSAVAQELLEIGEGESAAAAVEKAQVAVEAIQDDQSRTYALNAVAPAMAHSGDRKGLHWALAVAEVIRHEESRTNALRSAALGLNSIGEQASAAEAAKKALSAAEVIPDERDNKAGALSAMALGLFGIGEVEQAAEVTQKALSAAEVIENEWCKADVLSVLALALAKLRDREGLRRVLTVAEKLYQSLPRAKALIAVVPALALLGDREGLWRILSNVEAIYGRDKADALIAIAPALAHIGDRKGLHRALAAAEAIKDESYQVASLSVVAQELFCLGEPERASEATKKALTAANAIRFARDKAEAISALAPALTLTMDREELRQAMVMAERIHEDHYRALALSAVAKGLHGIGEWERAADAAEKALAAVEATQYAWPREFALSAVASALAQLGNRELQLRALAAAEAIQVAEFRAKALRAVAQGLNSIGEQAAAVEVAKKALAAAEVVENESTRTNELSAVAQVLLESDDRLSALRAFYLAIQTARLVGRPLVFDSLKVQASQIAELDNGKTLWQIYLALQEVDSWFGRD